MMKLKFAAIAAAIVVAGVSQASAGGLSLNVLNGNGVKTGSIVVAPSVGIGNGSNILSGNGVLNNTLQGGLNGILNNNTTNLLGILSGGDGGRKPRHH
ncbi:hypothetical protein [Metarhizobium album]|nr:hypothetical protein [Rhizobium album]